jgi:hypothetical protein
LYSLGSSVLFGGDTTHGFLAVIPDIEHIQISSVSFFFSTSYSRINSIFTIDNRCEDGRFPASASCVKISNPNSFSSSETRTNSRKRSCKSTYLNELNARKPIMVSISQISEEEGLYSLVSNTTTSNPGSKAVLLNAYPG